MTNHYLSWRSLLNIFQFSNNFLFVGSMSLSYRFILHEMFLCILILKRLLVNSVFLYFCIGHEEDFYPSPAFSFGHFVLLSPLLWLLVLSDLLSLTLTVHKINLGLRHCELMIWATVSGLACWSADLLHLAVAMNVDLLEEGFCYEQLDLFLVLFFLRLGVTLMFWLCMSTSYNESDISLGC